MTGLKIKLVLVGILCETGGHRGSAAALTWVESAQTIARLRTEIFIKRQTVLLFKPVKLRTWITWGLRSEGWGECEGHLPSHCFTPGSERSDLQISEIGDCAGLKPHSYAACMIPTKLQVVHDQGCRVFSVQVQGSVITDDDDFHAEASIYAPGR